jgi:ectoine hydroxylase-related dioxygenase (phytanoyl-CoA dioxygenase family)
MLTPQQVDSYFERGFTLAEGVVAPGLLTRARDIVDAIVARAGSVTANNEIYDLEESHTPEAPRVRRIKEPVDRDPLFWELVRSSGVIGPVKQLIGPDLRLHGSKLNMKSAGYGAPVEWHQDWAFYPHTNEDILAIGVMLDDVTPDNGPLQIIPGSHRGPVHDHQVDGFFVGAIDVEAAGLDVSKAVTLTGSAGSMTIHHVRAVHGSALNHSGRSRRMLFYEIAAADAWPLATFLPNYRDFGQFFAERMITGTPTLEPRMVPVPVRMPGALRRSSQSIYNLQLASRRYFEPYRDAGQQGG